MPKQPSSNYGDELAFQRTMWQRKPALRRVYQRWYERIVRCLAPEEPIVELGAGCGNFKEYFPSVIATDVIQSGAWIDRVVDARDLPFGEGEIGNFVAIDCLHHLPRPLRFLRSAARSLKPGGRLVILEPAATPWARLVWRLFHHEPVDLQQDVFAEDGLPEPDNNGFSFANMALATILFVKNRQHTLQCIHQLRLVRCEHSDFLVYPATGGFSYRNLLPRNIVPWLHPIENALTWPFARWLTGLRVLTILEKGDT